MSDDLPTYSGIDEELPSYNHTILMDELEELKPLYKEYLELFGMIFGVSLGIYFIFEILPNIE